jgi:hypothetical protein
MAQDGVRQSRERVAHAVPMHLSRSRLSDTTAAIMIRKSRSSMCSACGDALSGMRTALGRVAISLACALACAAPQQAHAVQGAARQSAPDPKAPALAALTLPPTDGGPVRVRARFDLHDINEIDDDSEVFQFTGVMTLVWTDPRAAFDPVAAGVSERLYVGNFQFNESSPSWYPQAVLVNESGLYSKSGVIQRVLPDGTCTLIETINAAAKSDLDMRRYPFDRHVLSATFEMLGYDSSEVVFEVEQPGPVQAAEAISIPQWDIEGVALSAEDRASAYAGSSGKASALMLSIDVRRQSFYIMRLVVFPLALIVGLSFSVFWMDRSSLGDRISVSFIGILTGVTYQLVMSQSLPQIAYPTLMHAFLYLSFFVMCTTVVVNLVVGTMDKRQNFARGDRIDYTCRWLFPLVYMGMLVTLGVIAAVFKGPALH